MVPTLFGVFDLVAKAPILNMHQFNGKNGCASCLHPGEKTQTYPPGTEYTLRTTRSMKADGAEADREGKIVNGIKGSTVLASLVDLASGSPIDYMHCVLEGVVKRFMDKWVNSTHTPYYLNKKLIDRIDASFTVQHPPHDFTRAIQQHRNFWKASEYRSWLLFYSLPLLLTFLPPLYIHHFALLVCSMHMLLQPKLTSSQIDAAEVILRDFVALLPELYNEKDCTLNSHLLLHLGEHTRQWGPLWTFSAFGFEHKNGFLMGHIHSTHKIADQLLFSLNLNNTLDSLQDDIATLESERVLSFLNAYASPQNKLGHTLFPGCYVLGDIYCLTVAEEMCQMIQEVTGNSPREVRSFNRIYYKGMILHSQNYGHVDAKRDSTICSFRCNGKEQYGRIEQFYIVPSCTLAAIKLFSPSGSLLQTAGVSGRAILQNYQSTGCFYCSNQEKSNIYYCSC